MSDSLFSRRTDWPEHSNRISQLADKLRAEAADFIDLTESNPTRCGFAGFGQNWPAALADAANLRYAPDPIGLRSAREAVAGYYAAKGVKLDPDQIVLTSGTSEAYNFVFRLLTHPGQAVMTPAPSYPLIDLLLDLNDIRQHRYPLSYDNGWSFDAANARQARQPQTRALIAIHPNNPTGHAFSSAERDALVDFTISEKMALVVDEVFLDYGPDPAATFAAENRVLTFTLSGISKVLALPQMKLSWIVVTGPEAERREALRRLAVIADTFLSVSTPAQHALPGWLQAAPEVHRQIRDRVAGNRRALEALFKNRAPADLLAGSGAWTAVLRFPEETDDESAAYDLLNRRHVLAHPGYLFDFPSGSHLVLSLLPEPEVFAEGARRLFLI